MKNLDKKLLNEFINEAAKNLTGDWIIIGGTVLPLLGINHRVTVDIDFVNVDSTGNPEALKLMQIAEKLKLPVETINQAGSFFLHKIKNFKDNMALIVENKNVKIFRPNINLFFELKISRLSESDLLDCLEFIKFNKKVDKIDLSICKKLINSRINSEHSSEKIQRLKKLLDSI